MGAGADSGTLLVNNRHVRQSGELASAQGVYHAGIAVLQPHFLVQVAGAHGHGLLVRVSRRRDHGGEGKQPNAVRFGARLVAAGKRTGRSAHFCRRGGVAAFAVASGGFVSGLLQPAGTKEGECGGVQVHFLRGPAGLDPGVGLALARVSPPSGVDQGGARQGIVQNGSNLGEGGLPDIAFDVAQVMVKRGVLRADTGWSFPGGWRHPGLGCRGGFVLKRPRRFGPGGRLGNVVDGPSRLGRLACPGCGVTSDKKPTQEADRTRQQTTRSGLLLLPFGRV